MMIDLHRIRCLTVITILAGAIGLIPASVFSQQASTFSAETGAKKPKPTPTPSPSPIPPPLGDPDGVWIANSSGNWSDTSKWTSVPPGGVADGAGATADFTQVDITGTSGVTITIDGVSRTIGTFLVGDSTSTFRAYTFASTGGATLTFNNNGNGAVLTQVANTGSNVFNSTLGLILADNLTINNNASNGNARTLTISGGLTGTGNLTLNSNGTTTNPITFDTTGINITGSITNSGTGNGSTTIGSAIGNNVTGVTENSATSTLILSAANTYSGPTIVNNGTLQLTGLGSSNNSAFTINLAGTLELNNPNANNTANHVGSGQTITMNGGMLSFTHLTSGGVNYSTATGPINLATGFSTITANQAGTGQTSTLTLGSLGRSPGATVGFTGDNNLGTSRNQIGFTTAPTLVNSVLPYATFGGTGTTATFAGLSGGNIVSATPATTLVTTGGSSATDYNLVGTLSGITTESIGSLRIQTNGSNQHLDLNGGSTLTLAGDGLLFATLNNSYSITGGNVTVGNGVGGYELIVHQMSGGTGTLTISSNIVDNGANAVSLTKSGPGTLILSGANTYSGTTYVSAGTLRVDNNNTTTARLANTSNIIVSGGGTLLLSQTGVSSNDRINNAATMTLNGGTFNTGGLSEHGATNNTAGIGALTLQSSSIIDMGAGSSVIAFADSHLASWTGTLSIYNWSGSTAGNGTDQLYFGNSNTGLTSGQLGEVTFYSDSGITALGVAQILVDGEIVPVPEPGTWFAGTLAVIGLAYLQRKRFALLFKRVCSA